MGILQAFSSSGSAFSVVALVGIAGGTIAYLGAVYVQSGAHRRWSGWRITSFLASAVLLAVAVSPPVMAWAHHDLRGHMLQHLLMGMFAPLGLVLAAPMTLLLRTLDPLTARRVTTFLRSRPVHLISHPVTALMLNVGGMYLLYMTPLYAASLESSVLHHLIHVHVGAAGYLFCWAVLAGPDPAPYPLSMRFRVTVLFIAIAAHAILGKLMYGYLWPRHTPAGAEEVRAAAKFMYYGGDLAEMLLAAALFGMWYCRRASRRDAFL